MADDKDEISNIFGGGPSPDVTDVGDTAQGAEAGGNDQTIAQQEAAEAAAKAAAAAKPPPGYVPINALDEARNETRDLRAKIDKMNALFENTVRMMQTGGQRQQQPTAQAPALPDAEKEPIKHMQQRFAMLEQAVGAVLGGNQQQNQQQAFAAAVNADEMNFKRTTPDYDNALNFVRTKRLEELTGVMGFTPQAATQTLAQEEFMIAGNALQRGESPAKIAYDLAKKWGYQPAGAGNAQNSQTQANADKLKAAAAGIEAAKSLGSVPGKGGSEELTLEAIADMDGEALSKAFDKIMGGQMTSSNIPEMFRR